MRISRRTVVNSLLVMGLVAGLIKLGILILGGVAPTTVAEFPAHLSIAVNTEDGLDHKCGATLIAPRMALTAAHCVDGFKEHVGNDLVVVGGVIDLGASGKQASVKSCRCHHNYANQGRKYDLGLFMLSNALDVQVAQPATLAEEAGIIQSQRGTAVGWTWYPFWDRWFVEYLAMRNVGVCTSQTTWLCGGDKWHGVMFGDSGGGLVPASSSLVVAGVVTQRKYFQSNFVRVAPEAAWISSARNELETEMSPTCTCY